MQTARANAKVDLWFNAWMGTALDEDWVLTGKDDGQNKQVEGPDGCTQAMIDNSNENGCTTVASGTDTWKTRTIGAAEVTQASKVKLLAAAEKEKAAAQRWETVATEEAAAAAEDLTRGQELLADLVADIAPVARLEITARNALATAKEEQGDRVVAALELGDLAVAASGSGASAVAAVAATGARAVLDAAAAAKDSVEAQQAFHNERMEWAEDNLKPAKKAWEDATAMKNMLDGMVTDAEDRYDNAREQCKREAFEEAQKAREKAREVADARAAKVADVLRDYTALATFASDGSVNTLCNYLKP